MVAARARMIDDENAVGRLIPKLAWWVSGAIGSVLLVALSAVRLPLLGTGEPGNYSWYNTASGNRLHQLILDQVQYLWLADHFSGRVSAPKVAPFSSRTLAPWIAGHLGGDPAVSLWIANVACLVLGAFAIARLTLDLTGKRQWTLVAVLIWSFSFPAFWYTSKALVDPAAVGLAACVVLALYRGWLVPGLLALFLAVWAKETALVVVPIAVAREWIPASSTSRWSSPRWRSLRASGWVVVGIAAYLTAGSLAGGHEITFAPWVPSSLVNMGRVVSMNFAPGALLQFIFTVTPAVIGLGLWLQARSTKSPFLPARDGVPLVVGVVFALALSIWSFVSALWDGRTAWMTLALGALLIAAWCADREPTLQVRQTFVRGLKVAGALFGFLVVWVLIGGLLNAWVVSGAAPSLRGIKPRFSAQRLVVEPVGRTSFSGDGDGSVKVDSAGTFVLRFQSTMPLTVYSNSDPLNLFPARSGEVLVDSAKPGELEIRTSGVWTAELERIDHAMFWEALSTISSSGPRVLLFPGGLVNSVDIEVRGDPGHIRLTAVGRCRVSNCPRLRIWESRIINLPAGTEALVVDSPGAWKLVPGGLTPSANASVLDGTIHD